MNTAQAIRPVGDHIRDWRQRRRMSQLDLALEAEISARHLSFVETGRASPSRDMVLRLAEQLDVPLRERNQLLVAAGFAPVYAERALDDPALDAAKKAIDLLLKAHAPFPALAIDRHWTLIAYNEPTRLLMGLIAPHLLEPPVNVLRASLHPEGLAPRVANLGEWRAHIFGRLGRQVAATGDPTLAALLTEFRAYPGDDSHEPANDLSTVVTPLILNTEGRALSFLTTTTVFGTPADITLSELAIETFFPADEATAKALGALK
ncbi:MAG: helix-turn-helix domain-containing protein [Hyphomonadaceae bacterium]